mmetsp:Transcript_26786/g.59164  ORF Transcript_26786/g.59164 Transcript_26786/m.59164 type:complete len:236 (+) Transcript_26786:1181-1888(+)
MPAKHNLVLLLLVHGLDGVLQHGVIPVPLLHVHRIQAPIIAHQGHVPPAVVADVRQPLNHLGPHPIAPNHVVRPAEALHSPHPHALRVEAVIHIQSHVLKPAGEILKHGDDHALTAPDTVSEQVPHALASLPELQARRRDTRHHDHRVFGLHPFGCEGQPGPINTLELRCVRVRPPGLQLFIDGEIPVGNALGDTEQGGVVGLHLDELRGHHVRQGGRNVVLVNAREYSSNRNPD